MNPSFLLPAALCQTMAARLSVCVHTEKVWCVRTAAGNEKTNRFALYLDAAGSQTTLWKLTTDCWWVSNSPSVISTWTKNHLTHFTYCVASTLPHTHFTDVLDILLNFHSPLKVIDHFILQCILTCTVCKYCTSSCTCVISLSHQRHLCFHQSRYRVTFMHAGLTSGCSVRSSAVLFLHRATCQVRDFNSRGKKG